MASLFMPACKSKADASGPHASLLGWEKVSTPDSAPYPILGDGDRSNKPQGQAKTSSPETRRRRSRRGMRESALPKPASSPADELAGATGFEPVAFGFGDAGSGVHNPPRSSP